MASLLTEGLKQVEMKNDRISSLSNELIKMDMQLQDAHYKAKEDPDQGETVLELYVAFLAKRDELIEELHRENLSVPWQMRMKIDEFEQSLKERRGRSKRKKSANASTTSSNIQDAPADATTISLDWERKDTLSIFLPIAVVLIALIVAYVVRKPIE
ncbi:hypothetical protein THRCLA_07408 [Thraustotheca clavata]|uniref:Uncharacterized protein n=1 Tax=Thraustotheca clavata TaxID=74557 RepID=A0A1V9ZDE3_9STRA|nr:hypothetical protein THRCLA_07408 [Thraustotheca clavata]